MDFRMMENFRKINLQTLLNPKVNNQCNHITDICKYFDYFIPT